MATRTHLCPDWDYMKIGPGDPEFECCTCQHEKLIALANELAYVHIGDGDELGVIARQLIELIDTHYPVSDQPTAHYPNKSEKGEDEIRLLSQIAAAAVEWQRSLGKFEYIEEGTPKGRLWSATVAWQRWQRDKAGRQHAAAGGTDAG